MKSNGHTQVLILKSKRRCSECASIMLLVDCIPAYVGTNINVYQCSMCDNTEKVTKVSRAWLYTCSKELRKPV